VPLPCAAYRPGAPPAWRAAPPPQTPSPGGVRLRPRTALPRRSGARTLSATPSSAADAPAEQAAPLSSPGGDLVAWREWELDVEAGDITWPEPLTPQQRVTRSLRFWSAVGPVVIRYTLMQASALSAHNTCHVAGDTPPLTHARGSFPCCIIAPRAGAVWASWRVCAVLS
jgi:hypothetical protein